MKTDLFDMFCLLTNTNADYSKHLSTWIARSTNFLTTNSSSLKKLLKLLRWNFVVICLSCTVDMCQAVNSLESFANARCIPNKLRYKLSKHKRKTGISHTIDLNGTIWWSTVNAGLCFGNLDVVNVMKMDWISAKVLFNLLFIDCKYPVTNRF